jgi:hypothetical protein
MRLIFSTLLLSLFTMKARSDAPAAPPTGQAIVYEIRELTPAGITQYSPGADSLLRQYLEFRNSQGTHYVIYEEGGGAPPLRNVAAIREMARAPDSTCAIDIECSSKAFCTGDCRNMYYETSNLPGDALAPDRNKCKVTYFSCEPKASAVAPQAAPAAPVANSPLPPAN